MDRRETARRVGINALRYIFLAACFGCLFSVAKDGRWEARLTLGNSTWFMDLGRAPIWAPPADSTFAQFRELFKGSLDFLVEDGSVSPVLKLSWMIVDLCLYLWPVSLVAGILYLLFRKDCRDLVLHLALFAGIAFSVGGVFCVGLWMMFGGWGPPLPEFFGGASLIFGLLVGWADYHRLQKESGSPTDSLKCRG